MSRSRKVLLVMLALAMVKVPLDALLAAVLPDVSVDAAPQMMASAAVALLLLGMPALLLRPWKSVRLVRAEKLWPALLLGGTAALLARAAMTPVDAAWQQMLGLRSEALPTPESAAAVMMYILSLAVIPAMAEEAFFRGGLLTGLLDGCRRTTAVLLTTMFFVLMHGRAANLPSLLVVSLLLTLLMLHSGSAAVPAATHFFYNISALVWRHLPGWGSAVCGAALTALLVFMIVRQPKMAHPPMERLDGLIAAAALVLLAAQYLH